MSFYGAIDTPIFGLLLTCAVGFMHIFPLGRGVCDVHSLRFDCGGTSANLLMASMAAGRCSPHACFSKGGMPNSTAKVSV